VNIDKILSLLKKKACKLESAEYKLKEEETLYIQHRLSNLKRTPSELSPKLREEEKNRFCQKIAVFSSFTNRLEKSYFNAIREIIPPIIFYSLV